MPSSIWTMKVFGIVVFVASSAYMKVTTTPVPNGPTLVNQDILDIYPQKSMNETLDIPIGALFEGDIAGIDSVIFLDSMKGKIAMNGVRDQSKRWIGAHVPYEISSKYSNEQRSMILLAMRDFERQTCVRFLERHDRTSYLAIAPDYSQRGCWSYVGRNGNGMQRLGLQSSCLTLGIIQHELMHAVGFWHEQSRTDRDDYIDVDVNNAELDNRHNFDKYTDVLIYAFGQAYDFDSIMHYAAGDFAVDSSKPVIKVKPRYGHQNIGQRNGLSPTDARKINLMYSCSGHLPRETTTTRTTTKTKTTRPRTTIGTSGKRSKLEPGDRLGPGNFLRSTEGTAFVAMEHSGFLVVYNGTGPSDTKKVKVANLEWQNTLNLLATKGTAARESVAVLQSDCNLVVYLVTEMPSGSATWASHTPKQSNDCFAEMRNNGEFVLKDRPSDRVIWTSSMWNVKHVSEGESTKKVYVCKHSYRYCGSNLPAGMSITFEANSLYSCTRDAAPVIISQCLMGCTINNGANHDECSLGTKEPARDPDIRIGYGLSVGSQAVSFSGKSKLVMQADGNAVLYRLRDGLAIWSTMTSLLDLADRPTRFDLRGDGELYMSNAAGKKVWSSGTGQPEYAGAEVRVYDDGLCLLKDGECLWKSGAILTWQRR